jgi:Mrp family chromosome partitioning ATPase
MSNTEIKGTELMSQIESGEEEGIPVDEWDRAADILQNHGNGGSRVDTFQHKGRALFASIRQLSVTPKRIGSASAAPDTAVQLRQLGLLSDWKSVPIERVQSEFLRVCLPLFFGERDAIKSLGLTSAIAGEGKTSVAWLVSHALATSFSQSVVLVECDWDRPTFSRGLGLPASPGLAEYLGGGCKRTEIRYQFLPNLTIIPAGLGGPEALAALAALPREEFYEQLTDPGELLILDLPSVLGSSYGTLAVRLAEVLMLVVRAGATPAPLVSRASEELKQWRVEGLILNQVHTRIPHWLQRLL